MSEYLQGRRQSVIIGGAMSSQLPVLSGITKGSILGPAVFVRFINDIVSGVDNNT